MSILGTSGRSMSSSNVTKLRSNPQLFLFPAHSQLASQNHRKDQYKRQVEILSTRCADAAKRRKMDNFFISALVKAGTCRQHAPYSKTSETLHSASTSLLHKLRRRQLSFFEADTMSYHTSATDKTHCLTIYKTSTRDDYLAMLDYYREIYQTDPPRKPVLKTPGLPEIESPETSSSAEEPLNKKRRHEVLSKTATIMELELVDIDSAIESLTKAVMNGNTSNEQLYKNYQALPFPGVSYLTQDIRRTLLRRLSVIQNKVRNEILWYLSVVDDMKAAEIPLSTAEWSSAIHLVGRGFSKVSSLEVELALRSWKEMEQEAGVSGNHVTFNILFDIAAKAGKFALAEMILKEMEARKLRINRYAHVGLIYYYGLRGDGNGVRKAYRDFVNDGQIVDTAVLNCVIASLQRAGEIPAADQVYERMKIMYTRRTGRKLPTNRWSEARELGRVLNRAATAFDADSSRKQQLQDEQSLAPNFHTIVVLLTHHVSHTGELQRIAALLDDLQVLGLPIRGRIFLELFRGFSLHGRGHYSLWTRARLESVWESFLGMVDNQTENVVVAKWIAIWAVRAFAKCSGEGRTLEIWDELKSRWKPGEREEDVVSGVLGVALSRLRAGGEMKW
ncbi:hypothetical protein MMC26_006413 [Xylographa opegraphella]|nr:hypothetical protein [Xylographa opegraphella]